MSENWKEKWAAAWPVLLVLPILAFVFSFGVGRFSISPSELLHTLFYICELADFEIEGRIVLIDKQTGRVWR